MRPARGAHFADEPEARPRLDDYAASAGSRRALAKPGGAAHASEPDATLLRIQVVRSPESEAEAGGEASWRSRPGHASRLADAGAPLVRIARQVRLKRSVLASADAFVLDTPQALWIWNGRHASNETRARAVELCELLAAGPPKQTAAATPSSSTVTPKSTPQKMMDPAAGVASPELTPMPSPLPPPSPLLPGLLTRPVHVLEEGTTEGDASGPEYCDYRYKGAHGFWGHLPGQRVDSADHGLGLTVAPPAREPARGGTTAARRAPRASS